MQDCLYTRTSNLARNARMASLAPTRRNGSERVGKARSKPDARQVHGSCPLVYLLYCSRTPLVPLPSLRRLCGSSMEPLRGFDSPGWPAIQMRSHFLMNLLAVAVRQPRPSRSFQFPTPPSRRKLSGCPRFVFPGRGIEVGFIHDDSRFLFPDGTTAQVLRASQGILNRESRPFTAPARGQSVPRSHRPARRRGHRCRERLPA
jgi:hypothetical protein